MHMTFVRACTIIFVVLLAAWTHATQAGLAGEQVLTAKRRRDQGSHRQ